MEYFQLFGIEPAFTVDAAGLERRFYALSRKLHPDVYARSSPQEQQAALDATARLNDAYRTLRDPYLRAEYLLKHFGVPSRGALDPEFLEDIFELNERVEEGDPAAGGRLATIRADLDRELEKQFAEFDRTRDRAVLADIRSLLDRRNYFRKIISHV